jgi:hypothetical protein
MRRPDAITLHTLEVLASAAANEPPVKVADSSGWLEYADDGANPTVIEAALFDVSGDLPV